MPNKNVRIYFDGLMVFCFLEPQPDKKFKECRVGILTSAEGHEVALEITRKRQRHPDETTVYTIPHNQIKNIKHLWLYLSPGSDSHPFDSSVRRNRSFDQIFRMERYYNPKPTPIWDAMRPALHITTGEFKSAIVNNNDIYRLISVEGVTNLLTPLFHAKPTVVKSKLEKAYKHFKESHQEVGKLANFYWTDIDVKADQRLVLAVGDESAPSVELFSVKPGEGEFIRAFLTNMPSYTDSIDSHHMAHHEGPFPDEIDSPSGSTQHRGHRAFLRTTGSKADREKEENRRNYLKKKFHFLYYYDVLELRGNKSNKKQYVLLRDDEDWIEGGRKRGPRPDPPCIAIEC